MLKALARLPVFVTQKTWQSWSLGFCTWVGSQLLAPWPGFLWGQVWGQVGFHPGVTFSISSSLVVSKATVGFWAAIQRATPRKGCPPHRHYREALGLTSGEGCPSLWAETLVEAGVSLEMSSSSSNMSLCIHLCVESWKTSDVESGDQNSTPGPDTCWGVLG